MTGTGTQTDPYIVDNWTDFLSVCDGSSTYVKWADGGGTIDFNDINPDGYTSEFRIRCHADYNGWTFKNLHFHTSGSIRFDNGANNLNLLDFYADDMTGKCFGFYGNSTNIKINGIYHGRATQTSSVCPISTSSYTIKNSAVNLEIYGNDVGVAYVASSSSSFITSRWENCAINLDIKGTTKADLGNTALTNCLVTGSIKSGSELQHFGYSCTNTVFDIEIDKNVVKSAGTPYGICLYNSDKATFSDIVNYVGVTTEQLKNAEYLHNLGFPIGVD